MIRVISSDDGVEETLLTIPNRKVKLYSVNGTAWETVWKSRTLPGKCGSIAQSVEQRTENPRVPGSIPGRATRLKALTYVSVFFMFKNIYIKRIYASKEYMYSKIFWNA